LITAFQYLNFILELGQKQNNKNTIEIKIGLPPCGSSKCGEIKISVSASVRGEMNCKKYISVNFVDKVTNC
jgi:hypothetical protein